MTDFVRQKVEDYFKKSCQKYGGPQNYNYGTGEVQDACFSFTDAMLAFGIITEKEKAILDFEVTLSVDKGVGNPKVSEDCSKDEWLFL